MRGTHVRAHEGHRIGARRVAVALSARAFSASIARRREAQARRMDYSSSVAAGVFFFLFFIYASCCALVWVAVEIRRSGARLYTDGTRRFGSAFGCVADATRGSWESVTCGACSEWDRKCR